MAISFKVYANSGTKLYRNGQFEFLFTTSDRFLKLALREDDYISITPAVSTVKDNDIEVENINDFAIDVKNTNVKEKSHIKAKSKKTVHAVKSDKLYVSKEEILSNADLKPEASPKPHEDNTVKTIYEIAGPKGSSLYKNGSQQASIYFEKTKTAGQYVKDSLGTESYISIGPDDADTTIEVKNPNSFSIAVTELNAEDSINNRIRIEADSTHSLKFTKSNKFYITKALAEHTEMLFNLFLVKINDVEKNGGHLELSDLLNLCEFSVYCDNIRHDIVEEKQKQGSRKKRSLALMQPGSWKPPEDWELHNQYIFEVFNPQTTEYSLAKPKEKLKPGEKLEEVSLSFSETLISRLLPRPGSTYVQHYANNTSTFRVLWDIILSAVSQDKPVDDTYRAFRTVRKTEQAPKLKDINIEEAPEQDKSRKSIAPTQLNQIVQDVIVKMGNYQNTNKLGRLQCDHIMELYQRAFTPQSSERVFWYLYTDAERRSPFNYRQKKQNAEESNSEQNNFVQDPEPRILEKIVAAGASLLQGLFYGGRFLGDPNSSPIVPLSAAALFGAPKKCE
ncbi:hypothetical protein [Rickettsiella endosymbiont of Rhagonycha lignosa]|uniref:hypothetical protein n=1 Tax=Rickettsiella endosymbiont of Rhagonycha lignosa TaxID=3077937 RepID=UPI00313D51A6